MSRLVITLINEVNAIFQRVDRTDIEAVVQIYGTDYAVRAGVPITKEGASMTPTDTRQSIRRKEQTVAVCLLRFNGNLPCDGYRLDRSSTVLSELPLERLISHPYFWSIAKLLPTLYNEFTQCARSANDDDFDSNNYLLDFVNAHKE